MKDDLPKGWALARLPDVCELNPGKPDPGRFTADTEVTFVPMAAVDAELGQITNPTVRHFSKVSRGFTAFQDDDVIMAKITPCMENGKAAIARRLSNAIGFGSTEFHVFRHGKAILPEYLFYFIRQDSFRKSAEANMTGSVGQKRVPVDFLRDTVLPIAPLNEQHRIVAKLKNVLSRVDAAQARLATIPSILKRFRQSVLAAACSGKLTADWRERNLAPIHAAALLAKIEDDRRKAAAKLHSKRRNDPTRIDERNLPELPELWRWATLDEIVEEGRPIIYGIIKPGPHDPNGVPYVRVLEMKDGRVAPLSELKRASFERASKFSRATLKSGDLLISKDGTIGKVAIVPPELAGGNITQHLVRASIHPFVNREFVACAVRSQHSQNWLVGEKKGVALQGVNVEDFRRLPLPIPPLPEQQEIVRRVEALFKTADALEARYYKAKAHVDKLTQSILARAFRGELVPQDPNDEPASALLQRLSREREAQKAKPKSAKREKRKF